MKLKLMNIFNVIKDHDEIIDDLNSLPEDINLNRIKTLAMNKVNAQDKAKNMKSRTIKTIGISTALALILGMSTISIINSNTLVEFFGEKINMVSPYIESSTELTKFKDLSITLDGYMVSGNKLTTIFTIEKNSDATFKESEKIGHISIYADDTLLSSEINESRVISEDKKKLMYKLDVFDPLIDKDKTINITLDDLVLEGKLIEEPSDVDLQYLLDNASYNTPISIITNAPEVKVTAVSTTDKTIKLSYYISDATHTNAQITTLKYNDYLYKLDYLLYPVADNKIFKTAIFKVHNEENLSQFYPIVSYTLEDVTLKDQWNIGFDCKNTNNETIKLNNEMTKTLQDEYFINEISVNPIGISMKYYTEPIVNVPRPTEPLSIEIILKNGNIVDTSFYNSILLDGAPLKYKWDEYGAHYMSGYMIDYYIMDELIDMSTVEYILINDDLKIDLNNDLK